MQLFLNFGAKARKTDPETSKMAAMSFDATDMEAIVLEVINQFPKGCIFDDILDCLPNVREGSISPRLKPLVKKGLIEDTGEKRMGRSGRMQRVLRVVDTPKETRIFHAPEGFKRLTINLREDIHQQIKMKAVMEKCTVTDIITKLLEKEIN